VLKELEVQSTPQIRVMNKIDLLPEAQRKSLIGSDALVYISAAAGLGLNTLCEVIDARLDVDALRRLRIRVPQSEGKLLAQIEARGHVLQRAYRDSAVQMEVDAPESLARVLDAYVISSHRRAAETRRKVR
jgi:GTPase